VLLKACLRFSFNPFGTPRNYPMKDSLFDMHHDISTKTAEEVVLFTLAESPDFREAKMK